MRSPIQLRPVTTMNIIEHPWSLTDLLKIGIEAVIKFLDHVILWESGKQDLLRPWFLCVFFVSLFRPHWMSGWCFGTCWIFSISYGVILSIDELIFSRWLLHHQPDVFCVSLSFEDYETYQFSATRFRSIPKVHVAMAMFPISPLVAKGWNDREKNREPNGEEKHAKEWELRVWRR